MRALSTRLTWAAAAKPRARSLHSRILRREVAGPDSRRAASIVSPLLTEFRIVPANLLRGAWDVVVTNDLLTQAG